MSFKLLTTSNPKVEKGQKKGFLSFILHLAPHNLSGYNTCPMASPGCSAACLNTAGRGIYDRTQNARIRKTRLFFENRQRFMEYLVADIFAARRLAARKGLAPVFRLNGTSDIRWETVPVRVSYTYRNSTWDLNYPNIMEAFSDNQFYDYTKIPNRRNIPANYHLTFSRSEMNEAHIPTAMAHGMNVAVVFNRLPERYIGLPVINGDDTDIRFQDPSGVVVGLKAKGKGRKDISGFVVEV